MTTAPLTGVSVPVGGVVCTTLSRRSSVESTVSTFVGESEQVQGLFCLVHRSCRAGSGIGNLRSGNVQGHFGPSSALMPAPGAVQGDFARVDVELDSPSRLTLNPAGFGMVRASAADLPSTAGTATYGGTSSGVHGALNTGFAAIRTSTAAMAPPISSGRRRSGVDPICSSPPAVACRLPRPLVRRSRRGPVSRRSRSSSLRTIGADGLPPRAP